VPVTGDLVEALVQTGALDEAATRLAALEGRGQTARPTPRLVGAAAQGPARLHAVRGEMDNAIGWAEQAVQVFASTEVPIELARSLLVAGRVHRRARHKARAHGLLNEAVRVFDALGAPIWAAQARAELARVGLRPSAPRELTETERRVAELAARGLNREVAKAAFLTPWSAEGVPRRIYDKLEISSRAELGQRMSSVTSEVNLRRADGVTR